jgi:hypothetical protein
VNELGASRPPVSAQPVAISEKANPFQVYPVRGLGEADDVLAITVPTTEVGQVEAAVRDYALAFGTVAEPYPKLLMAAKGDFGTGKTHLMLYAHAVLARGIAVCAISRASLKAPIAVMAVSAEAPIEEWYASELGPLLMERANPRALVRSVLARAAAEVAESDPDPDVQALAPSFRTSRTALYEMLREPGSFDVSRLNEQFAAAIARVCPRTSRSFRRVIEALRWEETAELAEEWLAGIDLPSAEMARLGIRAQGDLATRAANTICAVASLAREFESPFALFIDEFEHLTRFDTRTGSKRNITWTKRLVESLARRGAMVFISGHWEAWDQQGDFLDRFVGGRPIQLVRLSEKDVLDVVRVRAGAGAWPGFSEDAARWVVEATSGNIRRVITVLYDLWCDPAAPTVSVTEAMVEQAAARRLQPGSEIGILPVIGTAIRKAGGEVRRREKFGETNFDMTGYLGGELRLAASVIHARDELALIGNGERFAKLVHQIRTENPDCRGLVVMLGAVLQRQLSAIDAAFPETTLISGEEPGVVERLPDIVALALAPAPVTAPSPASQAALESTRAEAVSRAVAQTERSHELLGQGTRSDEVRRTVAPDAVELAVQQSVAREKAFEAIMRDLQGGFAAEYLAALLRSPDAILCIVLALIAGVSASGISNFMEMKWKAAAIEYEGPRPSVSGTSPFASSVGGGPPAVYALIQPIMLILSGLLFAGGIFFALRLLLDLVEFREYRRRMLRSEYDGGANLKSINARNTDLADMLANLGPRRARLLTMEVSPKSKGF